MSPLSKKLLFASAFALSLPSLLLSSAALAGSYPDEEPHETVVYDLALAPGGRLDPAVIKADLDYVQGMRAHHAGALTMSQEYLAKGRNPVLRGMADTIITNQRYEIAVLDDVKRRVETPSRRLVSLGDTALLLRPVATEGLEHELRYIPAPSPGAVEHWVTPGVTVDDYDVRWAKAMITHHRGALDMVRAYDADPNGRNSFLRSMNAGIVRDQSYEIAFLEGVIARYPGDASAIEPDPSMVHGMDMPGMKGHEGGHGGIGHPPAKHGGH
jgi:uncharacterized protein (DUF305 family)